MSADAYEPKPFEVIAVTLIGSKLPGGTIKLDSGVTFTAWPETVQHMGVRIGLTRVENAFPVQTKDGGVVQYAFYEDGLDDE
jgi:hypothetical protein